MKKLISAAVIIASMAMMSSCSSVFHTSTTVPVMTSVVSAADADLEVTPKKISYTYTPTSAVRRSGERRVLETAVSEALRANGNADVLVGFQYEIKKTGRKVKYVKVEGYPAYYTNIKPAK